MDFVISENNDRIRGMLWGLLVGDCLGSPAQFMDMDSFPRITEMIPCHYFHTPPGGERALQTQKMVARAGIDKEGNARR